MQDAEATSLSAKETKQQEYLAGRRWLRFSAYDKRIFIQDAQATSLSAKETKQRAYLAGRRWL